MEAFSTRQSHRLYASFAIDLRSSVSVGLNKFASNTALPVGPRCKTMRTDTVVSHELWHRPSLRAVIIFHAARSSNHARPRFPPTVAASQRLRSRSTRNNLCSSPMQIPPVWRTATQISCTCEVNTVNRLTAIKTRRHAAKTSCGREFANVYCEQHYSKSTMGL